MHMPTRDPRDQSYIDPTTFNHVMGKGISPTGAPDNIRFEEAAEQAGVDGVLLGHIKGQFLYEGRGKVPYFIDGGAGGELYTDGPVGTDHGYWHGFRLLRTSGGRLTTDTVPIFVKDGIRLDGPGYLVRGAERPLRGVRRPARVQRRGQGHRPGAARPRPDPPGQQLGPGLGGRLRPRRRVDLRARAAAAPGGHGHERDPPPPPAARRGGRGRRWRARA